MNILFLKVYGTALFLTLCSFFLEVYFLDKFTNEGNKVAKRVRKIKHFLVGLSVIGTVVLIWL